jgi:2-amino-4-hydroxy-6-hydroxymethyldihydropteridine diphosphokinase
MPEVYLSLGSNLGDRAANLWEAVRRLAEPPGCKLERVSRLYETAPIGPRDQPWFMNAVVRLHVTRSAHELLAAAKQIELDMGRKAGERWGPRLIDIDLLLYGDETIRTDDLVIPHPEFWNRRFVLVPLAEVLPAGPMRDRALAREQDLRDAQCVRPWPHAE